MPASSFVQQSDRIAVEQRAGAAEPQAQLTRGEVQRVLARVAAVADRADRFVDEFSRLPGRVGFGIIGPGQNALHR